MEFDKIKDLMRTLDNSNLMDFELKLSDGFYLRMNKYSKGKNSESNHSKNKQKETIKSPVLREESISLTQDFKEVKEMPKEEIKGGNIITSPIVGTFYSSSAPSKPAFVKVGDKIKEGDTVCIIEAMKVMNEIKSQFSGEVVEIFVGNEDMVEYNQPLFRIV